MSELSAYLCGGDGEQARGWVYDDGVVLWLASADDAGKRIRAEFGTDCLALLRYDPLDEAVVVLEGEPDALMDRMSACLTGEPNGLATTDCRSDSIFRKLLQAMGCEYPWFRAECRIPRPAVKERIIHINGEEATKARRLLRMIA
jgi:hypothetical protein